MKKYLLFFFYLLLLKYSYAQSPSIKWWYDVLDSSFGMAAAGDIDKDGIKEIVFGCYRNDSCIYALNGNNGTLQWKYNAKTALAEGCNDVAILMYDVDKDDTLDVIVPSSCNPKTFCFNGKNGTIKWQTPTAGSDSPPTIGDLNNDGKMEILHGGFDGKIICMNAEDGTVAWIHTVFSNAWVQTAPTLVDLDGNGMLDIVVATWAFNPDTSFTYAYKGIDRSLMWKIPMSNFAYHGTAVGDVDKDGKPDLFIGDYDGKIYAINGENGSIKWTYQASVYVGAPITIADVNQDGFCDIIFCDGYGVGALDRFGNSMWYYNIPSFGQTFRGVAIADVDGDWLPDIVFGTNTGSVYAIRGANGSLIWSLDLKAHMGKDFDINHAPLIADFDNDGLIDIFLVGGKTDYPNFQNNYGRAYCISAGNGHGPEWLMFQHDVKRQSNICEFPVATLDIDNNPVTKIFPNPSTKNLHFELNKDSDIKILNLTGQYVIYKKLNAGFHTFDFSHLHSGIYFINISNNQKTEIVKWIKE